MSETVFYFVGYFMGIATMVFLGVWAQRRARPYGFRCPVCPFVVAASDPMMLNVIRENHMRGHSAPPAH